MYRRVFVLRLCWVFLFEVMSMEIKLISNAFGFNDNCDCELGVRSIQLVSIMIVSVNLVFVLLHSCTVVDVFLSNVLETLCAHTALIVSRLAGFESVLYKCKQVDYPWPCVWFPFKYYQLWIFLYIMEEMKITHNIF